MPPTPPPLNAVNPPRSFSWSVPSIEAERGYDVSQVVWL